MQLAAIVESLRRVSGLCESLECMLINAESVEDNSSLIGSALFLLAELKSAIHKLEDDHKVLTVVGKDNDS